MTINKLLCGALLLLAAGQTQAQCEPATIQTSPALVVDATDMLNTTGTATFALSTNYVGNFYCSIPAWSVIGGKNTVSNISPYSDNEFYLKFPGDAYVKLSVTSIGAPGKNPPVGSNNGSTINTTFVLNLQLMKTVPTKNVMVVDGTSAYVNPVLLAQDSTGLTFIQVIARAISDFAYFIFNWSWPQHDYDIYYQPLTINFIKRETTCTFADNNKTVTLDPIDRASLVSGYRNGKKPFRLSFACSNLQLGATTRPVKAYLSSNNLLAGDSSTLTTSDKNGAHGVGIRVSKMGETTPLKLSASATASNDASSLFSLNKQQKIDSMFYVDLEAYYYVYAPDDLSAGQVNTTAIVNFEYD